jgi:formylglycine-generating enzyme required for sulfatase activity/alpha-tubulin suppressor-like RCC1 family protein
MKKKRSNFHLLLPFFAFLLLGLPKAKAQDHTLFIKSDGSLWSMGNNGIGQLGDGTTTNRTSPVKVVDSGVAQVATAYGRSLFLKSDGSLWAMGQNGFGQLGDGTTTNKLSPVKVVESGVIQIAAGENHSLFLKSDGSLWAMGQNGSGQLGDGTTTNKLSPVKVVDSGVTQIAAGLAHSLFLKADGSLWGMGWDYDGLLGGDQPINHLTPIQILASGVTQIAASIAHSLYLKSDGTLWIMGEGDVGNPGGSGMQVETDVIQIAAGGGYSLFTKSDGSLWAMGRNGFGQLGDGTTTNRNFPVQVVDSGVAQIAAILYHSLFLKSDGSLWAMGGNNGGELGDGTTTDRTSPVKIVDSGVVRLPEVPGNLSFGPGGGSSSGGGLYPVPYAGKVAVNGENFSGVAKFTFSIVEANGTAHWSNGADADEIIEVPVTGGRYLVLLGGQGMNTLPTDLFLTQPELYLKVRVDLGDGQGLRHLAPDQRITSTPHALSAEVARRLLPGTVTLEMLAPEARTKVEANATIPPAAITPDMLSPDTLAKFDQPIPRNRLPQDVLADLTRTITRNDLAQDVLTDLNRTITRDKLSQNLRDDLNATITRNRLAPDVLTDLNRTITRNDLAQEVLADLNRTITRDKLSQDLRDDLNATITRDRLAPDVLTDLNRTITRDNLAQDVLADLNRTVGKPDLDDLILKYLRPEITSHPQPQIVYTDDNVTIEVSAEGKYVSYQWKKNGVDLAGKTSPTLVLTEANATLHDGNYSVSVSNEFGTVTSNVAVLTVKIPPHFVQFASNLQMLWVEPGTFTMGSPTTETGRSTNETEHTVTLTNGFYLGKYEVTQAQYEAVMTGNTNGLSATPSNWPNNANRPVEKVSWDDVQIFLTRLNAAEQAAGRLPAGWSYVLPTESEWEYACRAGTTTVYSWGDDINASHANYNWDGNWNTGNDAKETVNVGQYAANPWGFFDMHGNVYEWTADRYAAYPAGAVTDPTGPASGSYRVKRGGSWHYPGTVLRSAKRDLDAPGNPHNNLGFRVGFKASQ